MNGRMTTAAINERDETDTVDDDDLAGRRVTPITHHLQKRGRFVGNKHFGYFLLLLFFWFPLLHSFLLSFVYSHCSRSVGFCLGNRWVWRGNVQLDQFPSFLACCINDYDLFARSGWPDAVPLLAAVLITLIESFRLLFLFLGWGSALRDVC